jgi:NAD(P)-dependent dehydrogenase (short-subunit alcohol dehydrogenase family)
VLVTGGNRGIGWEIARLISSEPGFTIVIACRDAQLGTIAADNLWHHPSPPSDHHKNNETIVTAECNAIALSCPFDHANPGLIDNAT